MMSQPNYIEFFVVVVVVEKQALYDQLCIVIKQSSINCVARTFKTVKVVMNDFDNGVEVGRCSGESTGNDVRGPLFSPLFSFLLFFFCPLSMFLTEGVLESKNLYSKSRRDRPKS